MTAGVNACSSLVRLKWVGEEAFLEHKQYTVKHCENKPISRTGGQSKGLQILQLSDASKQNSRCSMNFHVKTVICGRARINVDRVSYLDLFKHHETPTAVARKAPLPTIPVVTVVSVSCPVSSLLLRQKFKIYLMILLTPSTRSHTHACSDPDFQELFTP